MAYAPIAVQGSKVQFKQTTGITTYTDVPGCLSYEESAEDADTIDLTPIDSSAEVSLTGFLKPGSATMQLAYDPKNNVHQALNACAKATGSAKLCSLKASFNDATTPSTREWTNASVSKFEVKQAAKAGLIANVTIKLSGSPTDTAGS
mgnify:CR=1 FL=1